MPPTNKTEYHVHGCPPVSGKDIAGVVPVGVEDGGVVGVDAGVDVLVDVLKFGDSVVAGAVLVDMAVGVGVGVGRGVGVSVWDVGVGLGVPVVVSRGVSVFVGVAESVADGVSETLNKVTSI